MKQNFWAALTRYLLVTMTWEVVPANRYLLAPSARDVIAILTIRLFCDAAIFRQIIPDILQVRIVAKNVIEVFSTRVLVRVRYGWLGWCISFFSVYFPAPLLHILDLMKSAFSGGI
ncbi:hypothetical protein [Novipirellula sp.]|uniref:hypothetical protein n=1 Tax=Novipirellula sp. TaxID=2795430 RepID=UPI003564E961